MTSAQSVPPAIADSHSAVLRALPRPIILYALYVVTVCAFLWPTLSVMAQTWLASSAYNHGVFVAPVALWMIYRAGALAELRAAPRAILAVVVAGAIWLLGRAASVNLVEQIGFVSLLITGAAAILGFHQFRRWAFPLLFLYFMVPFGDIITPSLQRATAAGAVALLNLTGVHASIEGMLITTSAGAYEIAEACAGLNFLLAALMVAGVYSGLAFSGWQKIAAFTAFSIAFAIASNVARAYLVILAATLTNGKYSIGADHIVFGWVFYGFLLVVLIVVGRQFADPIIRRAAPLSESLAQTRASGRSKATIGATFLAAIVAPVYAFTVVDHAKPIVAPLHLPPLSAHGWRVTAPYPGWQADVGEADRSFHASYQKGSAAVQVSAGYFAYDRAGAEIAGYTTKSDNDDWMRLKARTITMDVFGKRRPVTVETLQDLRGHRLDVAALYWLDGEVFENRREMKVRIALRRLVGKQDRGGVIFIAARELSDAGTVTEFLHDLEPLSAWLARIDTKPSD